MKLLALSDLERYQGFSHKVQVLYTDLTTAGLTQILNLYPVKVGAVLTKQLLVARAVLKLVTPFTGGAIATMAADIGDTGSVGRFIANANTDLFTALATNTKPHVAYQTGYVYSEKNVGADGIANIQMKFTSTVGNVNAATAGEAHVFFQIYDLTDFDKVK